MIVSHTGEDLQHVSPTVNEEVHGLSQRPVDLVALVEEVVEVALVFA
jgi:hypothetical protein